jgi:glucan phosphoethanolaminetransferase (alkaline phosphatase superfamily)
LYPTGVAWQQHGLYTDAVTATTQGDLPGAPPLWRQRVGQAAATLWRLRWAILANVYLVAPLLVYDVVLSFWKTGKVDKIGLFALPASILSIIAVQVWARRLWLVHAVLLPFYLLVGVDLFLIAHYDCRLTSSSISMILGNAGDAAAYVQATPVPVVGGFLVVVGFFLLCLWRIRRISWAGSRKALFVAMGGLAVVYGGLVAVRSRSAGSLKDGVMDVVSHDRSSPFGIFAQSYLAYSIARDARDHAARSAHFRFGARRAEAPAGPELYVLVVGESSRPDHWSLYGYPRPTTPRLAAMDHLVVFRDVVAQAALTQIAVPLLITRQTVEAPQRHRDEKSILAAFAEAGFETAWLSTQQRDQFSGDINQYSAEAQHTRFFERRHDGVLIDNLEKLSEASPQGKLFVVLHTQGSHFTFEDRYPKESERFPTAGLGDQERMINGYDDSIAYTDEVLARLFAVLARRPGPSAALYVADHGENLRDDGRGLFGHFLNNEYDLPVPMLLWCSDEFARRWPDKVKAAQANAGRRLSSRVVFWSMLDLAGITATDEAAPAWSVLRPDLVEVPRLVQHGWGVTVDFDHSIGGRGGAAGARGSGAGGGVRGSVTGAGAGVTGAAGAGAVDGGGFWSTGVTGLRSAGDASTRGLTGGVSRRPAPERTVPASVRVETTTGRAVSNVPASKP